MVRSRSAEQVARVLLASAVRHDTLEVKASREGSAGAAPVLTLRLTLEELGLESTFQAAVGVHLSLFDKAAGTFVGATHALSRLSLTEPLLLQSRAENILFVVEIVGRDERKNAAVEGRRVLMWGYRPLSELHRSHNITLRPGSAQLLLLDSKLWPTSSGEVSTLNYECTLVTDSTLIDLMRRIVPLGVVVPESFTENTLQTSTNSFRCIVRNIQLNPIIEDKEWRDNKVEWRVAAVAHNGYQQLGHGSEVSLVFDENDGMSNSSTISDLSNTLKQKNLNLHSVKPLEMDGLPVHSATSLVLAIRRKKIGEQRFEVIGFCVFPLCIMPMKDRDIRVENLPALNGPFSCRDPRMIMLKSASPYDKLPFSVTLTIEYYDIDKTSELVEKHLTGYKSTDNSEIIGKSLNKHTGSQKQIHEIEDGNSQIFSPPLNPSVKSLGILSTEEYAPPVLDNTISAVSEQQQSSSLAANIGGNIELTYPTESVLKQSIEEHNSIDIFKMLCNVMEELRRLREIQEENMRYSQHSRIAKAIERTDENGKRLDDAIGIDIVDLSPNPVSITWEVRCQLEENLQPILHPIHGRRLDDHIPITGEILASLFGIRFEGISVDSAINVPEDICFMFSFGPLPFQTIGPIHTTRIDKSNHIQTFKLYEGSPQRGGVVWCEPLEATQDSFIQMYQKQTNATLYIHVYDALTMFYIGSANVQLTHFRRPYNSESTHIAIDLAFYHDLSLTERNIPAKVLPLIRNAGQLHVTLFCVATSGVSGVIEENKIIEPPRSSRVIIAKKLPHATLMENIPKESEVKTKAIITKVPEVVNQTQFGKESIKTLSRHQNSQHSKSSSSSASSTLVNEETERNSAAAAVVAPNIKSKELTSTTEINKNSSDNNDIHWRRVQYVKQLYGKGTILPGVPIEHNIQEADIEFRLRYLEKQRDECKSRKIAETLMERLTVHHYILVASFRPETTRTSFQNPFNSAMQFTVDIDSSAFGALEVMSSSTFYLGPREQIDILLIIRLNRSKNFHNSNNNNEPKNLRARVFTSGREVVRIIDIHAKVGPPFIDRRYEIFGPPGEKISKKIFSRLFSSSSFPITTDRAKLLTRMRDLCARIIITSENTTAEANAVLDPITQTYIVAWENITIHTIIPNNNEIQCVEYLTLFEDESMSKVIETWELSIFACQAITSRELYFGQTTTVAIPSSGIEALYCSDKQVKIEQRENSYLLHLKPQEIGTRQLLLHTLTNQHLAKTLLTIPVVYPTPTYTQNLELSLVETTAPVFRRLQFKHNGIKDEVFTIHHNYKYQLRVSPKQFALAPGDSQFITLQIDMLSLPEGQMEGRWPMWIFINNSEDKTVESYLIQVILRAHRVIHDMA